MTSPDDPGLSPAVCVDDDPLAPVNDGPEPLARLVDVAGLFASR